VSQILEQRLDDWLALAEHCLKTGSKLGYREAKDSNTIGLLEKPSPAGWHRFTVLNSLRDVEPSVGLVLEDAPLFPGSGPFEGDA
jgi:hypothetical protein